MGFTVKQMARILTRSKDDDVVDRVIRQIRYWTQSSWLEPELLHTGTGVSRTYHPDCVYQAAVLMEVSRFGLSPMSMLALREHMGDFDEGIWRTAIGGKTDVYLVGLFNRAGEVEWKTDGSLASIQMLEMKQENAEIKHPGSPYRYRSAITINVSKLFSDLDFEKA